MHACFEHTVTVFFGDPDQGLNSASGVLLKLERPLLVTALHVIQCYLDRQAQEPSLRLQIAQGTINAVSERLIGQANGLDLVTLDLAGIDIQSFAERLSYFEPTRWPPLRVESGTHVIMNGFPKAYRSILRDDHAIQFDSWHFRGPVDSSARENFACMIKLERLEQRLGRPGAVWPDTYGALSGCPVFVVRKVIDLIEVVELVGIVYEASQAFHIIYAYHADLITDDGTLRGSFL